MAAHAVKYKLSGQVNRAVQIVDDGVGSDIQHVDGDSSSTRFRFKGSEDIGNGLTAGINFEMEVESNSSNATTMKQTSDSNDGLTTRFAEVFFSGDFGKVSIGQGSDATDGAALADLNNAWIAGLENVTDFAENIEFRGSGQSFLGITAGDVTPSYDGGRRDRIRYDTPAIGPLSVAVSHATNDRVDVMGKIAGSAGVGQYDVRVGYSTLGGSTVVDDSIVVSGAFKFAQGTSIAAAWGQLSRQGNNPDGDYYYIKLGHDLGNNSIAVDYKSAEDSASASSSICSSSVNMSTGTGWCGGTSFGLGFVHTMSKPGIDIYAGYRLFQLEDAASGVGEEDIYTFWMGSRIQFN